MQRLSRALSDRFDPKPKHLCRVCLRPRSASYQASHPLAIGEVPNRHRCSKCIDRHLVEMRSPEPIIHEVHHYYHTYTGTWQTIIKPEEPTTAPASQVAELSSEGSVAPPRQRESQVWLRRDARSFPSFDEGPPPPVYAWTKPSY